MKASSPRSGIFDLAHASRARLRARVCGVCVLKRARVCVLCVSLCVCLDVAYTLTEKAPTQARPTFKFASALQRCPRRCAGQRCPTSRSESSRHGGSRGQWSVWGQRWGNGCCARTRRTGAARCRRQFSSSGWTQCVRTAAGAVATGDDTCRVERAVYGAGTDM